MLPFQKKQALADKLGDSWWTPLLFLALGVGLAFTPCVLPMYPILTGIVLGGGKAQPRSCADAVLHLRARHGR